MPNFQSEPSVAQKQATVAGSYGEGHWPRHLPVYFVAHDGGRSQSKRLKQKNDCTVRALAIALALGYDDAYDMLARAGRRCSRGFSFRCWAATHGLQWTAFPAIKGQTRMNPAKFCNQFRHGRWIVRTAKHVFAVVDGVVHDEMPPHPGRCMYGAWRLNEFSLDSL